MQVEDGHMTPNIKEIYNDIIGILIKNKLNNGQSIEFLKFMIKHIELQIINDAEILNFMEKNNENKNKNKQNN